MPNSHLASFLPNLPDIFLLDKGYMRLQPMRQPQSNMCPPCMQSSLTQQCDQKMSGICRCHTVRKIEHFPQQLLSSKFLLCKVCSPPY